MTDTEAKALALVNEIAAERGGSPVDFYGLDGDIIAAALCRAIEREAATEARHAAELREQAERFSEAARSALAEALKAATCASQRGAIIGPILAPFILPAPDPLVEAWQMAFPGNHIEDARDECAKISAAIEKRGGKIVWEAGE